MSEHSATVKSTSDLTPSGLLGYAKGIAASLAAILVIVVEFLPEGEYRRWTQGAIAVLGAIATIAVPNKVEQVQVVPAAVSPAVQPPLSPPPPPGSPAPPA